MTRLLVECTYVFEHPKVNSGIQRVVRNVIRELPEADETVECIPVAMLDGTLYQVHSLAPLDPRPHSPLVRLRILVERAANYFWLGQRTLEKRRPFRSSPWARRLLYVACRLFAFAFLSIPLRLLDRILGKQQPAPVRATPLEHRAGDQLVLLDSSWHADFFPLAERLKSEGVGIVSVIYDLIPLTHPQFCDAGLVKVFNHWFDWIAATADGYVAISETIRDEVRAEMLRRIGPEKVAQRWFDYFHLGSELDLVEDGASVEPDLLRMFKAKAPVFLMVSTIEPRKNHGYLLDAFERAWAQGSQARLCIAGRIGWKCEALVERVRQHPELNKRLFMFNDLSDKSLEYAYSHAASLVFPSYVEGFGLPLVEAMQRGLPAMGSDIPVFREIGGEFMAYFDLADPQTLANLVTRFEATGEVPGRATGRRMALDRLARGESATDRADPARPRQGPGAWRGSTCGLRLTRGFSRRRGPASGITWSSCWARCRRTRTSSFPCSMAGAGAATCRRRRCPAIRVCRPGCATCPEPTGHDAGWSSGVSIAVGRRSISTMSPVSGRWTSTGRC